MPPCSSIHTDSFRQCYTTKLNFMQMRIQDPSSVETLMVLGLFIFSFFPPNVKCYPCLKVAHIHFQSQQWCSTKKAMDCLMYLNRIALCLLCKLPAAFMKSKVSVYSVYQQHFIELIQKHC